jgi:peptide deformylase
MILPITSIWNPILNKVCQPIQDVSDPDIQQLIADMIKTLDAAWWVWLAAPQVDRDARLFVMCLQPTPKFPENDGICYVVINPVIISHSEKMDSMREGCLSIPAPGSQNQLYGEVPRWKSIQVRYWNEKGEQVETEFEWLMARIFQHEYDHLDGILFLERMDNLKSLISGIELERRREAKKIKN